MFFAQVVKNRSTLMTRGAAHENSSILIFSHEKTLYCVSDAWNNGMISW